MSRAFTAPHPPPLISLSHSLSHSISLSLLLAVSLSACDGDGSSSTSEGGTSQAGVTSQGGEGGDAGAEMMSCPEGQASPSDELCDGVDNDCDGSIDEGFNLGERCERRLLECLNEGVFVCADNGERVCDAAEPSISEERCDERDNDCDGSTDEGFNTQVDLNNCGACGVICDPAHATGRCVEGACVVSACDVEWTDDNGDPSDGCECSETAEELCDGLDNDCDGQVDELYAVGTACQVGVGACFAAGQLACVNEREAQCDAREGSPSEELCDGLDNDCDGVSDEDYDLDADGSPSCEPCLMCGGDCPGFCLFNDCQDDDPNVFPTAYDRCGDGLDQNCDGVDAPCTEANARATVLRLVSVANTASTCPDLNGDGVGDNAFGAISAVANASIENYIATKQMNILLSARGFDLSNPEMRFNLSVLLGRWAGNNDYLSVAANYDELGDPVMRFPFSRLDASRRDGGFLEGGPGRFLFTAAAGEGVLEVPIEDAYIKGDFSLELPDTTQFTLTQGLVSGRIDKVALNDSLVLIDEPIRRLINQLLVADIDVNGDDIPDSYSICLLITLNGVNITPEPAPEPPPEPTP